MSMRQKRLFLWLSFILSVTFPFFCFIINLLLFPEQAAGPAEGLPGEAHISFFKELYGKSL